MPSGADRRRTGSLGESSATATPGGRDPDERDLAGQDPEEVLRRILAISPEDAAEVREQASEKAAPKD
jgi:hypothetical protein